MKWSREEILMLARAMQQRSKKSELYRQRPCAHCRELIDTVALPPGGTHLHWRDPPEGLQNIAEGSFCLCIFCGQLNRYRAVGAGAFEAMSFEQLDRDSYRKVEAYRELWTLARKALEDLN